MAALAPGSPTSYNIAPGQSQADLDIKKKMALALMQQGADASPVQHWTQGLARVAQGLIGGYGMGEAAREDEADRDKARSIMNALSGGGTGAMPVPSPATAPIDPTAPRSAPTMGAGVPPSKAIASIESGGRYDATGPVIDRGQLKGDRAYGKYQVMGSNVGPWTKLHFGQELTPDQFLQSPEAQDAVFKGQFGQYTQKYGSPEAASRAWFAGPGGMNNLGATDQLGTSVGQYGSRVAQALAPGQAPVGAPVDQPRGGLGDDRRSQLVAALSQTRAGAPMAQALFAKELDREATRARPLTEDEKKIYPGAVAIKAGGEPIFPPPSTNVQLSTVANPVLEGVGKQIVDQRKNAQTAAQTTIPIIHDARKLLDEGALTGTTSGIQLAIKKVGSAFGIPDDKIANTEAFRSAIGNEVLAHIKALGANPSNADRDYIEKVQGGQINLDEPSLRKILDMTEKYSRNTIRNFNADSKKLMAASPDGTYKQIAPLMNYDEPGPYVGPQNPAAAAPAAGPAAVPAAPAGTPTVAPKIRKFNPATGKIE